MAVPSAGEGWRAVGDEAGQVNKVYVIEGPGYFPRDLEFILRPFGL